MTFDTAVAAHRVGAPEPAGEAIAEQLHGLPAAAWWRLFIDKPHHAAAEELADPAGFYDFDLSKGHRRNMMAAFRAELADGSRKLGTRVDLDEYVRLHDLVSAHLPDREIVRRWSCSTAQGDALPLVAYSIGGKGVPAADINDRRIDGLDLLLPASPGLQTGERAVSVFEGGRVRVNYADEAAPRRFVAAILDDYYRERQASKLGAIVRAVRTLHVTHAFRDANGRLHVMLLLNKFLLEQGFCPVILPHGPEVFGGSYTLAELEHEVRQGMRAFLALRAALEESRCGGRR